MGQSKRVPPPKSMRRPSAEVRAQEEADAILLKVHGFWRSDGGWRHRNLTGCWPTYDAKTLIEEADSGMQDAACAALRGGH